MNVNGLGSVNAAYTAYSGAKTSDVGNAKAAETSVAAETGVVYESSGAASDQAVSKKEQNAAIVEKMKADLEARTAQMTQLVQDMLSKQGKSFATANDMWKFLAGGNYTVDAQTKAQAQADIAEDGYWGVKQTSERIFDFAKALAGDDTEKMKKMQEAFEKGFKQAEKTWGGALPQISQDTHAAVTKKFEDYFARQE